MHEDCENEEAGGALEDGRVAHWCMSLKRREDRRFVLRRTLPGSLAERMVFLDAVDGEAIPKWKADAKFPSLRRGAWAVRLSKCLALRRFLRSSYEFLCLYEDDVALTPQFGEALGSALRAHPLWECVFLGGRHSQRPYGGGALLRCRSTYNNHCLLLDRRGATKALAIWTRTWRHAWSDRELEAAVAAKEIDAYCPRKPVAYQRCGISDNWKSRGHAVRLFRRDCEPWMGDDDAHVLHAAASPGATVVEWGSGGSTLLLADRVGESGSVISIEHSRKHFDRTRQRIEGPSGKCVDLRLVPPRPERAADDGWRYMPGQLRDYVAATDPIPDGSVDLVFIDGRERVACALVAARILKPGGLLLFHDFWARKRYRCQLAEFLHHYTYQFETPTAPKGDPQGLAAFEKMPCPQR